MQAADVIHRWIAAFNRGEVGTLCALYDPRAILWATTAPDPKESPEAIARYFDEVLGMRPPPQMRLVASRQRTLGDAVVLSGIYELTLFPGTEPQGLPARFTLVLHREAADRWVIVEHHSSLVPRPLS